MALQLCHAVHVLPVKTPPEFSPCFRFKKALKIFAQYYVKRCNQLSY